MSDELKFGYQTRENFIKAIKEVMNEYNIILKEDGLDFMFVSEDNKIFVDVWDLLKD